MMTSPDFGRSIRAMTRALTFVTDSSSIDAVPSIKNGNQQAHTFGLGAMGLHSYLAKHHIEYGSPESVEFTNIYFMLMNYWTLVESNNIARERQETFVGFEKSKYADGSYFDKYVTGQYVPKSDRIKELFDGHFIPQAKDWEELRELVKKDGLYHQINKRLVTFLSFVTTPLTKELNQSTTSVLIQMMGKRLVLTNVKAVSFKIVI